MSDRQVLVEQGAGICAWGLGALGITVGNQLVAPIAVTGAVIYENLTNNPKSRSRAAVKQALKALEDHPEIPESSISAAAQLFKEQERKIGLDVETLKSASARSNFPNALYEAVFAGVSVPKDDCVEQVIRLVLSATYEEMRKETSFDTIFQQESLKAIEAQIRHSRNDIKEIKALQKTQIQLLKDLSNRVDGFPEAVTPANHLSLEELKALAAAFDEHALDQKPALVEFLTKKAEDYRSFKTEIKTIGKNHKRLSKLKGAAQEAIERLDFEEVEEILSSVQQIELEEAARTAEIRANNALLRGKVQQAFNLLLSSANSFDAIDPKERIKRLLHQYCDVLRNHALRYGGPGLHYANRLVTPLLDEDSVLNDEQLHLDALWWNALLYYEQGVRSDGEVGMELLRNAISQFQQALVAAKNTEDHQQTALLRQNLGNTLQQLGGRLRGVEGVRLLEKAVVTHKEALAGLDKLERAQEWGRECVNAGNTLLVLASMSSSEAAISLISEAIDYQSSALIVFSPEQFPEDWAKLQHNIALSRISQAAQSQGAASVAYLNMAISALRLSLEIRTIESHPIACADSNKGLSEAYFRLSEQANSEDRRQLLEVALSHIEVAHKIYDSENLSYYFNHSVDMRDRIVAKLDAI